MASENTLFKVEFERNARETGCNQHCPSCLEFSECIEKAAEFARSNANFINRIVDGHKGEIISIGETLDELTRKGVI